MPDELVAYAKLEGEYLAAAYGSNECIQARKVMDEGWNALSARCRRMANGSLINEFGRTRDHFKQKALARHAA